MNPETALALAKSYVKQTLDGAGALKGKDGVDGQNGADGNGIASIERTNGNGSSGSTDTYTITMTNGETYDFNVYNGADGKDGKDGADGTGGSGGSTLAVYSTEETVVGTWIDGKPIYRKCTITSSATFSSSSDPTLKHNIENLGTVVRADTVLYDDGGQAAQDYHRVFPNISNSDSWNGALLLTGTHYKFILGSNMKSSLQKVSGYIYIIVEYTKTTDSATIAIPSATALMAAYEEGVQNA